MRVVLLRCSEPFGDNSWQSDQTAKKSSERRELHRRRQRMDPGQTEGAIALVAFVSAAQYSLRRGSNSSKKFGDDGFGCDIGGATRRTDSDSDKSVLLAIAILFLARKAARRTDARVHMNYSPGPPVAV